MSEYVMAVEDEQDHYGRIVLIANDIYKLFGESADGNRIMVMDARGEKAFYPKMWFRKARVERERD